MKRKITFLIATVFMLLSLIVQPIKAVGQEKTETTTTYIFTAKTWTATCGGSAANWTSGKDGDGFSNNGIQVLGATSGVYGTSPGSFDNITKIVATYNTNKSQGAATLKIQIGSNSEVSKSIGYSGSGDGRTANFTSQFDYATAQSGSVKVTIDGSTNSIYLVKIAITTTSGGSGEATTTTISDASITNTNKYVSTEAGSLSASVTHGSPATAVPSATVTWSGDDDEVAVINASTGVVTLVGAGTVTFTATYAGAAGYNSSSDTYEMTVTNENPAITTIWSENFSTYSANDEPSEGDYDYACSTGTKVMNEQLAGGSSPELLVAKNGGTFSATIPLLTPTYGYSGDLTLKYKTNAKALNVKTTTDGITVKGEASAGAGITYNTLGEHTITFEGVTNSTENITIVFTATTGDNVRLDDILLKGEQVALTKVATPIISPTSGAVASGTEVTITCSTDGASIYYTNDNTTPTSTSTAYDPSHKPTITSSTTIKAIAVKDGLTDSDVASVSYTIAVPCATPTFSVAAGEVEKGTTVTLSTETADATIYYTTDGSTPTTSSTTYSSAITINSAMTIKAIAAKDGMANSEVASASYTVKDYVILPFAWVGGSTTTLNAVTGVTTNGLGSDYSSHSPYCQKMDDVGDYIQIKTNSKPSKVTVGVKMIGGGDTSKIKVQESADGSTFSDVQELTISGKQNDILTLATSNSFAATTRYVKIIKSVHGSNIGVGPITIDMSSGSQTITDLTITENNTITIGSGCVLTVTGTLTNNGTAANLIIEDGGQLIVHSDGVEATVKKDLPAAATKDQNWTTIASPVKNISIGTPSQAGNVTHLKDVDYALYRYNEVSMEWENHKNTEDHADFTTLESGRGYLYSRTSLETLSYVGEVNGSDYEEYTLSITTANAINGFHLIGNPYSHDIYKGAAGNGYAIPNSPEDGSSGYVLASGFYQLKNGTSWTPKLDDGTKIEKGEGILVQATTAGTLRIYNSATKPAKRANHDNIMFAVANSQYEDVTYALFDKGMGLSKINHRDANAPMLFIPQNGENYAIATMSDNTKSFNLSFKAMTTGKYTLSAKANGNYSYLHIFDRMTGEDIDMLLEGEYSFISSPNDNENRFIVNLAYLPNYGESNDIFAYQSGSDIYVTGQGELQIFDITGRQVMTTTINGAESINLSAKGVFIFRLIGSDVKTQKIVVE